MQAISNTHNHDRSLPQRNSRDSLHREIRVIQEKPEAVFFCRVQGGILILFHHTQAFTLAKTRTRI